jgi:eight-cysteine-cluster-containing protein
MGKRQKIIILLAIFALFCLFFTFPVFAQDGTEIQPEELEVKEPKILPNSGAYPIKEFFRNFRLFFIRSPVKKAELRLKFANEKLMEVKELVKSEENKELVEKTLSSYQDELEKLKNEIQRLNKEDKEKFLEKYINHALKQQMVLENIASQVKGEVYEKILANRQRHLERFKEVMEKVENKERLKEKIKETIDEVVAVAPLRAVKVYETIREVEEKVPKEIKPEIEEIKKEMVSKTTEVIKVLPPEIREAETAVQIKMLANPLVAQEMIEKIKEKAPDVLIPPVLPVEIIQEKIAPLPEANKIEVLERMTGERIKHLERLEEVKEKLEALPQPAVAPEVIKKAIERQLEKIEMKVEEIKAQPLPTASPFLEKVKEELKEAPKIREEIIKRLPEFSNELKEIKVLSPRPVKIPEKETGFCGWSTKATCKTDEDCIKGGCSAQVCQGKTEEPEITTCEWRDCYNAEAYNLRCGCFEGKCQWGK